jgi:hypothetical protein
VLYYFIPKFLDVNTGLDYKRLLLQLITTVNDTHANNTTDDAINKWKGVNKAPYEISFVEGKAVVSDFLYVDLAHQFPELIKGDIITHVNGNPVEIFVEERKPYTVASNTTIQLRNIVRDLLRTNEENILVQIIRNGKSQTCDIACFPVEKLSNGYGYRASHRLLSPDIGYIWIESLHNDSLSVIMEKFKDTKGIIIDLTHIEDI